MVVMLIVFPFQFHEYPVCCFWNIIRIVVLLLQYPNTDHYKQYMKIMLSISGLEFLEIIN